MQKKSGNRLWLILLVISGVLGVTTYWSHRAYEKANQATMSFTDPEYVRQEIQRTGKIPSDATVNISVFGPERRAAQKAETVRNIFLTVASASLLASLLALAAGYLPRSDKSKEEAVTDDGGFFGKADDS